MNTQLFKKLTEQIEFNNVKNSVNKQNKDALIEEFVFKNKLQKLNESLILTNKK